jgi:hypothetical protein
MKKTLIAFVFAVALAGCASRATIPLEQPVVQRVEYVIKVPPQELLSIPPNVQPIDVERAKQSDVAQWIILNEQRTRKLENMLMEIAKFFKSEESSLSGGGR